MHCVYDTRKRVNRSFGINCSDNILSDFHNSYNGKTRAISEVMFEIKVNIRERVSKHMTHHLYLNIIREGGQYTKEVDLEYTSMC